MMPRLGGRDDRSYPCWSGEEIRFQARWTESDILVGRAFLHCPAPGQIPLTCQLVKCVTTVVE